MKKKQTGVLGAFLRGFLAPAPAPAEHPAPAPKHDEDPLDPQKPMVAQVVLVRVEAAPITRAYARLEAEGTAVEACWHRGIGIRLWGENGCAPVTITCDDGDQGQLDYAFGEEAERLALS